MPNARLRSPRPWACPSSASPGIPIEELVRLAKTRWRIEHDYRELKTGLGLDHFAGRSFAGWHRHVTLAALAFTTMIRTTQKPLRRDEPLPACTNCR